MGVSLIELKVILEVIFGKKAKVYNADRYYYSKDLKTGVFQIIYIDGCTRLVYKYFIGQSALIKLHGGEKYTIHEQFNYLLPIIPWSVADCECISVDELLHSLGKDSVVKVNLDRS